MGEGVGSEGGGRSGLALPWILLLLVPAAAAVATVAAWGKPSAAFFLRDVHAAPFAAPGVAPAEHPVTAGIFSQIGIVAWSGATAVAAFAWAATARRGSRDPDAPPPTLLPGATLLTALLLVDDGFLLHDQILPRFLGLPQWPPLVAEAALAGWWAWTNRAWILRRRPPLLLVAGALLATSVATDTAFEPRLMDHALNAAEDGSKFVGTLAWLGFVVEASFDRVRDVASAAAGTHGDVPSATSEVAP